MCDRWLGRTVDRTLGHMVDRTLRCTVHLLGTHRRFGVVRSRALLGALGSLHALGTFLRDHRLGRLGRRGLMLGRFGSVARRLLDGRLGRSLDPMRDLLGAMFGTRLDARLLTFRRASLLVSLLMSLMMRSPLDALDHRWRGHRLGDTHGDRPRGLRCL